MSNITYGCKMSTESNIKNLSFEEALKQLEKIVTKLETGETDLEASIEAYSKGMELKEVCEKKLRDAKLKIEKINSAK